ncbi:MAG: replicative DNA helicase [Raineya sp.]|jgi:replicative DNA helicase|nr:replicative DNA helicase [Raineya sp.]
MEQEVNENRTSVGSKKLKPLTNSLQTLGKVQPQARELEEAILGALMLEKNAMMDVADVLHTDCFYDPRHQDIFKAILELFAESQPVDILTVKQRLQKMGKLETAGGAYYLAELTSKVNSAANIEYHARIVLEAYIKRSIIEIVGKLGTMAYEDTTDVFDLLDTAEQMLFRVSEQNIRKNYVQMSDLMRKALKELDEKKNKKDGLTGVPTGFNDLDRVTAGFQRSNLIIIAARPGMGKSAFIISVARNSAVEFQMPVAIFSLEMSAVELVNRLISAEAEIESEKIKKGLLTEGEWKHLHNRIPKLTDAPIYIDDTPALSVLELRAKARRLKAQHNIQLLMIDYLQLMSGGDTGKGNREQEIAYISRSLKNIAKELDIPVIALSQLSRAVETRGGDKKPQLSDLRESGSIEQDADMVMFLYRPEYYGITQDEEGLPTQGTGEVIIAKHRNGSLENIKLRFIGRYTKFANLNDAVGFESTSFDSFSFPNTSNIPSEFNTGFESYPTGSTITLGSKVNQMNNTSSESKSEQDSEINPPF